MSNPYPVLFFGGVMDLINDKIKNLYFKYLFASLGSALITSIYSVVDMAVVGNYVGPNGTAALAIIAPIWNIIYSLGLLMGVGGSILFSSIRGRNIDSSSEDNKYFTASFIGSVILSLICWIVFFLFDKPILSFFGASDETLLSLCNDYLLPIKIVLPTYLINQMLIAFLRNDNDPSLATFAVLFGGLFNVAGDILFTFTFDMGIFGAGLATAIGSIITTLLLCIHFFKKKNTLKLIKSDRLFTRLKNITINGFSSFFIDVAMGILTILFNRQIMRYLDSNALSVYGPIINISTFVQCCAYAVGQASQPIISTNFGANKPLRIKQTLKYALITTLVFSIFWTGLSLIFPQAYIYLFMNPTEEILSIGPSMIRMYSLSFILLPLNIFSTYYFQSIMKPKISFIISVGRGLIISGILIYLLPLISPNMIWFAMPITEVIIALYVVIQIVNNTKKLTAK